MSDTSALQTEAANSVAFVRFTAPDLSALDHFLGDFGLTASERGAGAAYYRAAGPTPYVYVAKAGAPSFDGIAFGLPDMAALEVFSTSWETPIVRLDGPGRGYAVRLVDPDGIGVEAVVFTQPAEPIDLRRTLPTNVVDWTPRLGQERRLALETAQACRLGHVVLRVSDLRRSEAWYKQRFGFLTSDEIRDDDGETLLALFLRFDRGETFTDHHSLMLLEGEPVGFHHAAFEVRDLDDLMVGHDRMRSAGYQHHHGIGRHLLGGQVYDYWRDPWGNVLEHWTDGDQFNAAHGSRVSTKAEMRADAWRSTATKT